MIPFRIFNKVTNKRIVANLRMICVRDSSGNPFVRDEQKIVVDSPTRRGNVVKLIH